LMEIPEDERLLTYDLSLLRARSADNKPRTYLGARGELPFDQ
jgi:hypothetical protein